MKKIVLFFLTVAIIVSIATISSLYLTTNAVEIIDSGTCGTNLSWDLDSNGNLTIFGTGAMDDFSSVELVPWNIYRSSIKNITIGNLVATIGKNAFCECVDLTSIIIPESVTNIGSRAFADCISLSSIDIPNSVTSIGIYAFDGCTSLESMTLPFVGGSATENTYLDYIFGATGASDIDCEVPESLKTVILSDTCTSIDSFAFRRCTGLTSVIIGESVTSIGYEAFCGCSGLTTITIPDSVTRIGSHAFTGCDSLEIMTLPFVGSSNSIAETSHLSYLFGDGSYSTGPERVPTSLKTIVLSDACTHICQTAFYGCTGLTSIIISNSVTTIEPQAFYGCTGLTSITIPDSVTNIKAEAFIGCTGLTSITVPDSVTSIGSNAFSNCTGLTSITIPNSINRILPSTFQGCTNLTSITIPNSVTNIGKNAFSKCTSLTSITVPDSVTYIEIGAFSGCSALESMTLPFVGDSAADPAHLGWIFGTTNYTDHGSYVPKSLKTIILSDACTSIDGYAFYNCSSLTSVIVGNSVTRIGSFAFYGCTSLESMTLPFIGGTATSNTFLGYVFGGVSASNDNGSHVPTSLKTIILSDACTSISGSAFSNCIGLTSITIPNTVTSIGISAFEGCTSLTSVRFYSRNQMSKFDSTISNSYRINENINFLCLCKDDQHTYSQESDVICDKCMFSRAPLAPTVAKVTSDSITLMAVDGYEYKIGDGAWTSDPIFTGLDPATEYTFYQRVAETNTNYVSESSTPFTVETKAYTSGNIDGVEGVTDADAEYLLMYTFFPEDYPVNQSCDFNGDGFVNDADAEHLLMYTFFPEDYPLH